MSEPGEPKEPAPSNGKLVLKQDELPPELRAKLQKILSEAPNGSARVSMQTIQQKSVFSGPVPHPDLLQKYEDIEPGLASRLVAMAEKNGEHIRKQERFALLGRIVEEVLGQIFGLVISLAFLGGGIYLAMNGHPVSAALTSGIGVATVAGVFVYGRRGQRQTTPPPPKSQSVKRQKGKR